MRRPVLAVERAARADLRAIPKPYRDSAVAKSYLMLARRLDAGVSARDVVALAREMRMALLTLNELAPPQRADDFVDEIREQREKHMREIGQEPGPDAAHWRPG